MPILCCGDVEINPDIYLYLFTRVAEENCAETIGKYYWKTKETRKKSKFHLILGSCNETFYQRISAWKLVWNITIIGNEWKLIVEILIVSKRLIRKGNHRLISWYYFWRKLLRLNFTLFYFIKKLVGTPLFLQCERWKQD